MGMQWCFSGIQDPRGNSDEERSFILGEESTDECGYRPGNAFQ